MTAAWKAVTLATADRTSKILSNIINPHAMITSVLSNDKVYRKSGFPNNTDDTHFAKPVFLYSRHNTSSLAISRRAQLHSEQQNQAPSKRERALNISHNSRCFAKALRVAYGRIADTACVFPALSARRDSGFGYASSRPQLSTGGAEKRRTSAQ